MATKPSREYSPDRDLRTVEELGVDPKHDISPALREMLNTTSYDVPGDAHSPEAEASADEDSDE